MGILKVLLFPLAWLFGWVTSIRNFMYDQGWIKQSEFSIPLIGVGNLAVGGTGKTPTVEYLIRLLHQNYKVATLSRGYGRVTNGFRLAQPHDNPQSIGDEPFQFYRSFGHEVSVAVDENRSRGIAQLLHFRPEVDVVLLDDVFQHRSVRPDGLILLTEYHKLFTNDFLMPVGRLREARSGARRADVIIVTKCPAILDETQEMMIRKKLAPYTRFQDQVFLATIQYEQPVRFDNAPIPPSHVRLVSALADGRLFEEYCQTITTVKETVRFADHYDYASHDVQSLQNRLAVGESILTTEKDMVKLMDSQFEQILDKGRWYYLPIRLAFLKDGAKFDAWVRSSITPKSQGNRN
jgi:tetraacyldisaccharide 4'-kinase